MGVVYQARQVSLNRVVALKMILAGQLASAADVQRFRAEAEAAANLDHPNIVPIYEVGEHEGQHYFSMKLSRAAAWPGTARGAAGRRPARGGPAAGDGRPGGPLRPPARHPAPRPQAGQHPPRRRGPAARHRLRPGQAGRGRQRADPDPAPIVGTPSYMAPEQAGARRGPDDGAATCYGLGAILYELLTGRPPFRRQRPLDTLLRSCGEEPAPPRTVQPGLPTATWRRSA